MDARLMDEEWEVLARLLPPEWQELANETGAIRRAGGEIKTASALLQLLLLHVATGLSLKQATARAQVAGLVQVSDVALLKRLRTSEPWLRELARRMFSASRYAQLDGAVPSGMRLRAVDATTISEPGSTGTDWRVHFSITLPEIRCDYYQVTDHKGAESYARFPVHPGDVILGDRGYCRREAVAYVLGERGHVIARHHRTSFPLLNPHETTPFELLLHLRQLRGHVPAEWPVRFEGAGKTWSLRLCAVRKTRHAAQRAKEKIQREAYKRRREIKPDTLECAEYTFVLTSLPSDVLLCYEVLELYRARWQIELCFKRLKSLLKMGHVPKSSDLSARAWIEGKLLTALLIERLATEASLFSPWGFNLQQTQPLARVPRSTR